MRNTLTTLVLALIVAASCTTAGAQAPPVTPIKGFTVFSPVIVLPRGTLAVYVMRVVNVGATTLTGEATCGPLAPGSVPRGGRFTLTPLQATAVDSAIPHDEEHLCHVTVDHGKPADIRADILLVGNLADGGVIIGPVALR